MADLLAMQPNMNIPLCVVAQGNGESMCRREILRPVFSVMEGGAMAERCSFLSYDALDQVLQTPNPEMERVTAAVRILEAAKKPIIVAGGGIRASGAARELVALAEKLQIPVATSLTGKDSIPGNHPLSVGVVGSYSRSSANRAVHEADLVFFAGSHFIQRGRTSTVH